jgi:hypothetical protein
MMLMTIRNIRGKSLRVVELAGDGAGEREGCRSPSRAQTRICRARIAEGVEKEGQGEREPTRN